MCLHIIRQCSNDLHCLVLFYYSVWLLYAMLNTLLNMLGVVGQTHSMLLNTIAIGISDTNSTQELIYSQKREIEIERERLRPYSKVTFGMLSFLA